MAEVAPHKDNKVAPLLTKEQMQGLHNLQIGVGEVCMLMAAHAEYGNLFQGNIQRTLLFFVLLNQCQIIRNKQDRSIGFILWAMLTENLTKQVKESSNAANKLKRKDWDFREKKIILKFILFYGGYK